MADFLPSSYMQMAPFMAALSQGQQRRREQETHQSKQQELMAVLEGLRQQNMERQQMMPHNLTQADLRNQTTLAQLPGVQADSQAKVMSNQYTQATQPSKITADIATNEAAPGKIESEKFKRASEALMQMSDMIDQIPAGLQRTTAIGEILSKQGAGPDTPHGKFFAELVRAVPSEQIPQALRNAARKFAERQPEYIKTMDQEAVQQAGATKRTGMTVQGQKDVEKMRIDAGKYDRSKTASNLNQALLKVRNAAQAAELYEIAADEARMNNDMQATQHYTLRAQQARQRAAEDAQNRGAATPRADMSGMGVPMMPGPGANAPVAGAAPTPQPLVGGAQVAPPQPGEVRRGYRFKGGNYKDKANWTPVHPNEQ